MIPFAEGVLAAGYKLVLCGFRVGGAKAQIATVKLLQHIKTAGNELLPATSVICVSFGAPQVLKTQVRVMCCHVSTSCASSNSVVCCAHHVQVPCTGSTATQDGTKVLDSTLRLCCGAGEKSDR